MTFLDSAKDVTIQGTVLKAQLRNKSGSYTEATFDINEHLGFEDNTFYRYGSRGVAQGQNPLQSIQLQKDGRLHVQFGLQNSHFGVSVPFSEFLENDDGKFEIRVEDAKKALVRNRGFWLSPGVGEVLHAWVYNEFTGEIFTSALELRLCCTYWTVWSGQMFKPAPTPPSLTNGGIEYMYMSQFRGRLDEERFKLDGNQLTYSRNVGTWPLDHWKDESINFEDYVRRARDGVLEWKHPVYVDDEPEWIKRIFGAMTAMASAPSGASTLDAFIMAIDLATGYVTDAIKDIKNEHTREFLHDTYVENGLLVRRGRSNALGTR